MNASSDQDRDPSLRPRWPRTPWKNGDGVFLDFREMPFSSRLEPLAARIDDIWSYRALSDSDRRDIIKACGLVRDVWRWESEAREGRVGARAAKAEEDARNIVAGVSRKLGLKEA